MKMRQRYGADVESLEVTAAALARGRPLDRPTRDMMESRFGRDFSRVRVHTGPDAAAMARSLRARAFALGSDVFFGEGEYDPALQLSRRLLAHELVHVLQQGGDRPGPGRYPVGPADDPLEQEAE